MFLAWNVSSLWYSGIDSGTPTGMCIRQEVTQPLHSSLLERRGHGSAFGIQWVQPVPPVGPEAYPRLCSAVFYLNRRTATEPRTPP